MNRLRDLRLSKGITQGEIVAKARVSAATLVLIEKYGYCPTASVREKIAAVLAIPVADIWPDQGTTDRLDNQAIVK